MPYRVAGNVVHDGALWIALAKGDRVFIVREGDVLLGKYRVEGVLGEGGRAAGFCVSTMLSGATRNDRWDSWMPKYWVGLSK